MSNRAQENLIDYIKCNQNKLYKIAYTYVRNQDLALDIVQESITKALENINKLKNEEFVKTWFYRILINEALKTIKKNKKYMEYGLIDNENYLNNNEEIVVQNIDIYNSIDKLNDKLKTVIILRFFENLKIEEIAIITKTNISTVKSRLYKGIEIIKKNMRGEKNNYEYIQKVQRSI